MTVERLAQVALHAARVRELRAFGEQSTCVKWYVDAHLILRRAAREQQTTMDAVDVRGGDDQRDVMEAKRVQRWSRMHDRPGWSRLAACD